jgi:hypothetical protein
MDTNTLVSIASDYFSHRVAWAEYGAHIAFGRDVRMIDRERNAEESGAASALVKVLTDITGINGDIWQDQADRLIRQGDTDSLGAQLVVMAYVASGRPVPA